MGELKILGEKRVKALLSVLDAQEKERTSTVKIPSMEDIKLQVDEEFGLVGKRAKLKVLINEANALCAEINEVTGGGLYITTNSNSSYVKSTGAEYKSRQSGLTSELQEKPLAAVKAEFAAKRTQLWLCETLEQAKAIVGMA
jgi:hypothetical protein